MEAVTDQESICFGMLGALGRWSDEIDLCCTNDTVLLASKRPRIVTILGNDYGHHSELLLMSDCQYLVYAEVRQLVHRHQWLPCPIGSVGVQHSKLKALKKPGL